MVRDGISHPHFAALYPPFATLLFRGWTAVSGAEWTLRIGFFVFDIFSLIMLVSLVQQKGLSPCRLMFYALNPLTLVVVAGEGHVPVILTASLFTGLYLLGAGRPVPGFFALGMAVMSGYLAIFVFPFVMTASNRRAWWAALIPLLCFSVYLDDPNGLWRSFYLFGSQLPDHAGLPGLLQTVFGCGTFPVLFTLLLLGLGNLFLLEQESWKSIYIATGFVLVLATALDPGHLLMVAPFMVFFPSKAWLFLMMTAIASLLGLAHEPQTGHLQNLFRFKIAEYIVFFSLIAYSCFRRSDRFYGTIFPPPDTVSIVIPALNEEGHLSKTVQSARNDARVMEVIVVDGGSVDRTRKVARQAGAAVLLGPQGRGLQISQGIAWASGDVIIVLHADAEIKSGAVERMLEMLANQPSAPGGAFEMDFESRVARIRLIAWMNNVRARFFGISFGDQGQFFRRAALPAMNGFPEMLLMEDVELSFKMKALGRPLFVPKGMKVSQRRWERGRFLDNVFMVMKLFLRYLFKRRFYGTAGLNHYYYETYYGGAADKGKKES
jgi:rSAM/selenodomain-associated transferase 2